MNELRALNRVGLASLAFGGFLLLSYVAFAYSIVWRGEVFSILPAEGPQRLERLALNESNASLNDARREATQFGRLRNGSMVAFNDSGLPRPERFAQANPVVLLLSPYAVLWLVVGLAFIANGYFLLRYIKKQEAKQTKEFVISTILTGDEKTVFEALRGKGGAMTQKELANALGYSPVKIHRVLLRLEQKKLVKSYPFGMTKKIVISSPDA